MIAAIPGSFAPARPTASIGAQSVAASDPAQETFSARPVGPDRAANAISAAAYHLGTRFPLALAAHDLDAADAIATTAGRSVVDSLAGARGDVLLAVITPVGRAIELCDRLHLQLQQARVAETPELMRQIGFTAREATDAFQLAGRMLDGLGGR